MKKILFVINSLSGGGAERVVEQLALYMSKKNEVHIIIFDNSMHDIQKRYPNIKVHTLNILDKKAIIKNKYLLEKKIMQLEKNRAFDLMTVHLPYPHLLTRLTKYKTSFIFVIHTVYSRKFERIKVLRKSILKFIYNNMKIIAVSEGVKKELKEDFRINAKFIEVINNPIDIDLINNKKKETIYFKRPYICFVGRLNKIKNVDKLIKIMKEIKEMDLVILGDGEEYENLLNLVNELELQDKVYFKGWVDNPYKWMYNAKAMLSLSEYEAFPVNMIECLACNTKVIAYDCDYGPREILKGELLKYLLNDLNDDIYKEIVKRIKEEEIDYNIYADVYDIKKITDKYLHLEVF
ncbi:glycosyltransferase [uncultured Clostridium sp.]|uniref:glycosyltransferase n=1 Tax=uncultured Clostridium sp. TaxID=59620 RepID=UPI00261B1E55|nr:glycosyltransferase [uncultured Clostridium sp.]